MLPASQPHHTSRTCTALGEFVAVHIAKVVKTVFPDRFRQNTMTSNPFCPTTSLCAAGKGGQQRLALPETPDKDVLDMDKLNTLRALMKTHDMKSNDVAELLCVEVQTVQAWLSVGQTRPIPDRQLQLLKRLLKAQ
jgi:hypothetical protein